MTSGDEFRVDLSSLSWFERWRLWGRLLDVKFIGFLARWVRLTVVETGCYRRAVDQLASLTSYLNASGGRPAMSLHARRELLARVQRTLQFLASGERLASSRNFYETRRLFLQRRDRTKSKGERERGAQKPR